MKPHKKRAVAVTSFSQILLKMDFCLGVKIYPPFFITFPENNTFPVVKIDVGPIQIDQFAHTDTGGNQKIDNRQISGVAALVSQTFQILISQSFFDKLRCLNFVNTADRTLRNIIFILKPDKKRKT